MNVIIFWQEQVNKWNEENKCGFCWSFGAPLKIEAMNIQQIQPDKKCCVNVFLTDLTIQKQNIYSSNSVYVDKSICQTRFTLYALLPDVLGRNNYNEILGHSIEGSRLKEIIEPLINCLSCEAMLDECEIAGFLFKITNWQVSVETAFLDNNYTGLKINATFEE